MAQRGVSGELVYETARIICEEAVLDYRSAKLKAAQRLGLGSRAAVPDNAAIQAAVIDYQRLYGGLPYRHHLTALRAAALRAMKLLAAYSPRLVGGAVTGAVTLAHRVQLHAFAEKPETIELFLHDRGIACEQADRSYRYPGGAEESVPLVRFEAGAVGVDVAVFGFGEDRRLPLSPTDGAAFRRLSLADAEKLVASDPATGSGPTQTPVR